MKFAKKVPNGAIGFVIPTPDQLQPPLPTTVATPLHLALLPRPCRRSLPPCNTATPLSPLCCPSALPPLRCRAAQPATGPAPPCLGPITTMHPQPTTPVALHHYHRLPSCHCHWPPSATTPHWMMMATPAPPPVARGPSLQCLPSCRYHRPSQNASRTASELVSCHLGPCMTNTDHRCLAPNFGDNLSLFCH